MSENPYQVPRSEGSALRVRRGGGDFSIGESVSEAFEVTKANFWLLLGAGVVGMLCFIAAALTIIGYFVVVPVLVWGGVKLMINAIDGKAEFGDLFSGFSNYGRVLWRTLVLVVLLLLLGLLGQSLSIAGDIWGSVELYAVGFLVNLAVTFFVMFRLYFAIFFLVDQGTGITEAIGRAWRSTSGRVLPTIGLGFLSTLIGMSGILLLFVGLFFTIPMSCFMWVSAYRQMTGSPDAAEDDFDEPAETLAATE
jgi:uncharacterized membrane protein